MKKSWILLTACAAPVIWGGGYRLYRFAGGQEGFDRRFGND